MRTPRPSLTSRAARSGASRRRPLSPTANHQPKEPMPLINTTGRHDVTTKQGSFGESKNGTPFFELLFADDSGATINGWLYLSEAAFENSVKTLRETFGFNGDFETLPAQVSNKRCAITVEEEIYEN